jgi:hypothetical protein
MLLYRSLFLATLLVSTVLSFPPPFTRSPLFFIFRCVPGSTVDESFRRNNHVHSKGEVVQGRWLARGGLELGVLAARHYHVGLGVGAGRQAAGEGELGRFASLR